MTPQEIWSPNGQNPGEIEMIMSLEKIIDKEMLRVSSVLSLSSLQLYEFL